MSAETKTQFEIAEKFFFEGLDFLDQEDYVNAEKHFRKAYEIVPERVSVINNLTGVLVKLNRIDEAKQLAEKSLKIDDKNALTWLNLGIFLQENREHESAANAFRSALALDESLHEARRGLGWCCAQLGEYSEAAGAWLTLLKQFPRSAMLLYSLSRLPQPLVNVDILSLLDQAEPDENESQEDFVTLHAFAKAAALDKASRHAKAWECLVTANRRPALQLRDDQRKAVQRQNVALAKAKASPAKMLPGDSFAGPVSLFILGPSRSGKTTLERFIGAIDGVKRGGETLIVANAVRRAFQTAGLAVKDSIAELPPALNGSCRNFYLEALQERAGSAKFFTNTFPGQIHDVLEIAALLPNARFIFLTRDPDDITLRIYMKKYKTGNPYAYDIGDIRDHIGWYYQMIDVLAERLPNISTILHYEDIFADPEATLRSVTDLCGLDPPDIRLPELHGDQGCAGPYRDLIAAARPSTDDGALKW
jgi:Flp pilus assembly protein TadD